MLRRALLAGIGAACNPRAVPAQGRKSFAACWSESRHRNPLTLAAVTAGLAYVTTVATYLPARRVLAMNPAQALGKSSVLFRLRAERFGE